MISTYKFEYSHTVGFLANQGRGFNNPVDLAFDEHGLMYVLNRAGPEVGIRLPYKRITICNANEPSPPAAPHTRTTSPSSTTLGAQPINMRYAVDAQSM